MKIAFASCMCTRVFENQPVWAQIAAQQPDYLVLLGDSIYLDINVDSDKHHPEKMDDDEFGRHIFNLYEELINQPQFSSLIQQMPRGHVFSIWDDHDFLWNDTCGAEIKASPVHRGKVRTSTAFQRVFRQALAQGLAANSFPTAYSDPVFWDLGEPPLSTPSIVLAPDLHLHLCDVRSFRTRTFLLSQSRRSILGDVQRAQIEAAFLAAPNAVHLVASGSTMSDWKQYRNDMQWLLQLAANHRTMLLSGDIHRNEIDLFETGGFMLHEVTSSGAAVRDAVVVGEKQQNYGLLDIDATSIKVSLFHFGQAEPNLARNYNLTTWG